MPAPGSLDYTALPASIRLWLIDHPGEHRAATVAAGITRPAEVSVAKWSQKVANALSRMARDGTVKRNYLDIGHKKTVGHYSIGAASERGSDAPKPVKPAGEDPRAGAPIAPMRG